LLKQYKHIISDSRIKEAIRKQVKIFDSTTISLFQEIMKCVGRKPKSGKSKGGVKAHTVINADEKLPTLVWYTPAPTSDHVLLSKLKLDPDTIYVFDKGYNDYLAFSRFSENKTGFVTRQKDNASYEELGELDIPDEIHPGVIKDEKIQVEVKLKNGKKKKLKLRRIAFWDDANKRLFIYITNLFDIRADLVAALYKIRWQIELLYKQLKQNFPLRYFLGDNENAIRIQIWFALIANLLFTVIQKIVRRKWAFSNIVSFCRLHLFNYIHLLMFLENPEKDWEGELNDLQLSLF
jgi:IS4 transposase